MSRRYSVDAPGAPGSLRNRHGAGAPDRCPIRHCGGWLEFTVGRLGQTISSCPRCERRRRGICRDCPRPVEGAIGKSLRCATCKLEADRANMRRYERANREERLRRARERLAQHPEQRERHNRKRAAWRKAHPDRVRLQKRREALRQSPKRLAYYTRYNAARREEKRAAARRRYYELHPVRPSCRCIDCGERVRWTSGLGRPPKRCDRCCSPSELRRRRRQAEAA